MNLRCNRRLIARCWLRWCIGHAFIGLLICSTLCGLPHTACAQTDQPASAVDVLPDEARMRRVEASVDRALEYLARHQHPDGAWPSGLGKNNGINGVCLLAFLGRGHVPGRGPFRATVEKAITFIAATQDDMGLYRSPNPTHGPMYEHALATLAMIESYGYLSSLSMRKSCQRAIDLIVKAQSKNGGWRYQPYPGDADLSVTVMQIVALRAAQNARMTVPKDTIPRAVGYVKACIVEEGGFAYQPYGAPGPARTAAGVLSMQLSGEFDHPAVARGLAYLKQQGYSPTMEHFWYLNYYAMQAHYQAGGDRWADWHPKVRKLMLSTQHEDGSWPGYGDAKYNGATNCFSTAMAAMSLEVYLHYLPAYQR